VFYLSGFRLTRKKYNPELRHLITTNKTRNLALKKVRDAINIRTFFVANKDGIFDTRRMIFSNSTFKKLDCYTNQGEPLLKYHNVYLKQQRLNKIIY